MALKSWFLLLSTIAAPAFGADDTGKLPRGAAPSASPLASPTPVEVVKEPSAQNPFLNLLCHDYLATPFWDSLTFSGDELYYLARLSKAAGKYNYSLLAVSGDPKLGFVVKKIFNLLAAEATGLLPHGAPAQGFSVISFENPSIGCASGIGNGVSIPLHSANDSKAEAQRRSPRQTVRSGRYRMIASTYGRMLFDMDLTQLREIDIESFQQRIAVKMTLDEMPLFLDTGRKRLYAYQLGERGSLLIRYKSLTKKLDDALPIPAGSKLIQQDDKFGFSRIDTAKNTLIIKELPGWSSQDAKGEEFAIALPKQYPAGEAGVSINFTTKVLVIFGDSINARERWRQVMIYDYGVGKKLTQYNLARNEQVEGVTIDPAGKKVFLTTRDSQTKVHRSFSYYDTERKGWKPITLP